MKNWQALGESDKAAAAKTWVIVIVATLIVLSVTAALLPNNKALDGILRIANVGLLLTWYYASGKAQADFVKSHFGKEYPRKGWAQPLLIAVGVIIGFILIAGAMAVVAAWFFRRG